MNQIGVYDGYDNGDDENEYEEAVVVKEEEEEDCGIVAGNSCSPAAAGDDYDSGSNSNSNSNSNDSPARQERIGKTRRARLLRRRRRRRRRDGCSRRSSSSSSGRSSPTLSPATVAASAIGSASLGIRAMSLGIAVTWILLVLVAVFVVVDAAAAAAHESSSLAATRASSPHPPSLPTLTTRLTMPTAFLPTIRPCDPMTTTMPTTSTSDWRCTRRQQKERRWRLLSLQFGSDLDSPRRMRARTRRTLLSADSIGQTADGEEAAPASSAAAVASVPAPSPIDNGSKRHDPWGANSTSAKSKAATEDGAKISSSTLLSSALLGEGKEISDGNRTEAVDASDVGSDGARAAAPLSSQNSSSLSSTSPSLFIAEEERTIALPAVDVNALKRNLVQRAMSEYKRELLDLLGGKSGRGGGGNKAAGKEEEEEKKKIGSRTGGTSSSVTTVLLRDVHGSPDRRADLIEEKLAAIAQANPVSTTTDSNLLEGEWEFVCSSRCGAASVLDPTRFQYNREQQRMGGQKVGIARSNHASSGSDSGGASSSLSSSSSSSSSPQKVGSAASYVVDSGFSTHPSSVGTNGGRRGRNSGDGRSGSGWHLPPDRRNPFRSNRRLFRLGEDLADNERPHIVETSSYLNGLWEVRKTYRLTGLSRTALELALDGAEVVTAPAFGGGRRWDADVFRNDTRGGGGAAADRRKGAREGGEGGGGAVRRWRRNIPRSESIRVYYLDNDLCISTTALGGSTDESPMQVYVRRDGSWGKSTIGKFQYIRLTIAWLWFVESPLRLRRKIRDAILPRRRTKRMLRRRPTPTSTAAGGDGAAIKNQPDDDLYEDEENRVVVRRSRMDQDERYRLLVLKLGEYGINADGTLREDEAWDGDEDPFVHMNPTERQEAMRTMKIGEIVEAGRRRKREQKGERGRRRRFWEQRKFVRPDPRGRDDE